jgi:(p)ppGpp synthase/HD superfamily hydrolase
MVSAKDITKELRNPTNEDKALVEKAYTIAAAAHDGHQRYSGEPYMSHVAIVALRL